MRTADDLNGIAYEVIGGAITLHRVLGPGCFESTYIPCLAYELKKRGLDFRTRVPVPLRYEEVFIPRAYEADVIVEDCVVLEIKAVATTGPLEQRQLQTYLRLTGCPLGLLLNFGALVLSEGIIRRVNNFPEGTSRAVAGRSPASAGSAKDPDPNGT